MYRLKAYARATYRAPGQLSLVRLVQILVNSLAFYCPFIHARIPVAVRRKPTHINRLISFPTCLTRRFLPVASINSFLQWTALSNNAVTRWLCGPFCYWNKEFGSSTYMHMSCGCWAIGEDVGAEFPVRFPGQFTVIQQVEENLLVFF